LADAPKTPYTMPPPASASTPPARIAGGGKRLLAIWNLTEGNGMVGHGLYHE